MGKYCESVGLGDDVYLDEFSKPNRIRLMGAFAMAMREGRFSRQSHGPLAESTVRGTILCVYLSFRDDDAESIQQKMRMENLEEFYQDSSGPYATKTQTQNNKKCSQLKHYIVMMYKK